jgi:3-oxoacyl-[acyl-carrier protein] reductase
MQVPELRDKTALVTGSSRGIGFAIASVLHREGCKVLLNARSESSLVQAAQSLPGSAQVVADVTIAEECRRLIDRVLFAHGSLDILVCNVGSGRSVPPGAENAEEWHRVFALNLWSATNMVEAARDALVKSKGVVVCISSICGLEVVPGAPVTYSAAKAALHAYVRGIARPLGKQGIRINAIAAGNILFGNSVWAHKLAEDPGAVHGMLESNVSLGKLGTPQDVAELAAFLASSRAGFATGSVWTLDGGQVRS